MLAAGRAAGQHTALLDRLGVLARYASSWATVDAAALSGSSPAQLFNLGERGGGGSLASFCADVMYKTAGCTTAALPYQSEPRLSPPPAPLRQTGDCV